MQADRAPVWQHARAAKRQSDRKPEQSRAKTADHRVGVGDDRREPIARTADGGKAASTVVDGRHAITRRRAPESTGAHRMQQTNKRTSGREKTNKQKHKQPNAKHRSGWSAEKRTGAAYHRGGRVPEGPSTEHRVPAKRMRADSRRCVALEQPNARYPRAPESTQ